MTISGAPIQAVLFDKDGTLMDFQKSWGPWTQAVVERHCTTQVQKTAVAEALGLDLTRGVFFPHSPVIAGTAEEALALLQPHFPDRSAQSVLEMMTPAPNDFAPVPIDGLSRLCAGLSERGYGLAVVTNDFEAAARDHLDLMGISGFFNAVIGYDSGFGQKPGAGPCVAAADQLGVPPQACVMVGDSLHDLKAGRAAGMRTIGVLTGVAKAPDLVPFADVVFDSASDILDWLSEN